MPLTSTLFACIHADDFPVQALLRLRPDLKSEPVAVLNGCPPQQTICSYNLQAHKRGVVHGMTRMEAESLTGLKLLQRNLACESTARAVLQESSGQFSPRIEEISKSTSCCFVLDISGSERLFGPPEQLGQRLRSAVASVGFRTSVAVSANFETAHLKAMSTRGVCIIPSGQEADALSNLPITILNLDEERITTFALWGIRTLGELAGLPETELVTRLGPTGKTLRDLARGMHTHAFCPIEPVFTLEESFEFEHPVEQADSLLFLAARMVDCLTERATLRALCLASIHVQMKLEGGREHYIDIKPAIPSVDRKFLLKLMQLELAAHPPQAAVVALTLHAEAGQSSKVQLGLFTPQMPEPSRLDVTLARLKAIVGEDRVGSPLLEDTHQSNQFRMERFAADSRATTACAIRPSMALRRMRPPCPVHVLLQSDKPVAFRYRNNRFSVSAAYGPWKSAGAWWSTEAWDSEEWDILAQPDNSAPVTCLLVHHLGLNAWQLEAVYD